MVTSSEVVEQVEVRVGGNRKRLEVDLRVAVEVARITLVRTMRNNRRLKQTQQQQLQGHFGMWKTIEKTMRWLVKLGMREKTLCYSSKKK